MPLLRRLLLEPRCTHLSHRLDLSCWRPANRNRYCMKHNRSCWMGCSRP